MKRENSINGDEEPQNGDGQQNQQRGGSGSSGGGGGGSGGGGGGGRGGNKRFRGNDESIRLLIPSRTAGAIIGKGGQHINRLRSEYKATINVEDCQGPVRIVHVSAEFENAISIIDEMIKNFDEKDDEYDIRMLIHQSLAGCVIGKGGSKIKEIRDKTGCRILKVFSNLCPQSSDRVVQCVGKAKQCVDAIRDILELVKDVPIKGPVQNYDPINYDDMFADKYGGYCDVGSGGGGGGGRNGGGGGGGFRGDRFDRRDRFDDRRGGRGNDRRDSGGRNMKDYIDPWAPNQGPGNSFGGGGNNGFGGGFSGNMGGNMGGGGGGSGGGGGFGGGNMGSGGFGGGNMGGGGGGGGGGSSGGFGGGNMGSGNMGGSGGSGGNSMPSLGNFGGGNMGSFGNNGGGGSGGSDNNYGPPNEDGKNTTQVTIPKDLAGAIIGKAGGRIRRIRMESNAFITIDEPLPGSSDRIITITGSPKQIQMAQYLLQQSVHEHRRQF